MHKNSDDRRAKRSRRLLKEGLLALMQEKRFHDISARDVTESADLNRGTFYLHYPDTLALLESIEDDIMAEAQALVDQHLDELKGSSTLEPVLMPLLDYILEKRKTIELLLCNNNASSFLDKLHTLIYKYSLDYAKERFGIGDPVQLDYFLSFVSFGIMAMVKVWISQDMTLPKQKLIAYADAVMDSAAQAEF
ncbi:MAG: TetR/AcrR family transcriptional regulator [Firmicutes bacterium]|nr:TetR/AcrR family transcriptional regulator [Bacillota bacterium]